MSSSGENSPQGIPVEGGVYGNPQQSGHVVSGAGSEEGGRSDVVTDDEGDGDEGEPDIIT